MKKIALISAAMIAVATPALAEKPAPSMDKAQSSKSFITAATTSDMRSSEWIGAPVINSADQTVGDINDFVIDSDGNIKAVIAGVGGFLGLGEKNVGLSYSDVDLTTDADGNRVAMVSITKDQLMAAPDFKTGKKTMQERAKEASEAAGKAYDKAKEDVKAGYEAAKESVKKNYQAAKDAMTQDDKKTN